MVALIWCIEVVIHLVIDGVMIRGRESFSFEVLLWFSSEPGRISGYGTAQQQVRLSAEVNCFVFVV
jgi:hypothetical protein